MFSISKGILNLTHPACKDQIDFFAEQNFKKIKIENIKNGLYDHRIAKHFYFSTHNAEMPVTVLVYGKQILNIHPGTSRVLAYYISGKQTMPAIFLQIGNEEEMIFASQLERITEKEELALVNQNDKSNRHFWQINSADQEYYKNIDNEKKLSKTFKEFLVSCLNQNAVDALTEEYEKNNPYRFWKLCTYIAQNNINKGFAVKPKSTGAWQYRSDFHWNTFFKKYDLFFAEMLPCSMSEFIANPQEVDASNRWEKKYKDTARKFPKMFEHYSLEQYVDDHTEIFNFLKLENKEIANLENNQLWLNCKGYEYLKTVQSVYKHGGINYSSSILTEIAGDKNFKYHPGRHLSFAKRFIGQADLHFVTVKKQETEWLKNYNGIKIIEQINSKDQIYNLMPKQMKNIDVWLQGTFPVYTWPFINGEIDLPADDWGDIKDCGYTVITSSGKDKNMQTYLKYAKIIKSGQNIEKLFKGKKKNFEKLNERYLGFLLNDQEGNEFEKTQL